MAKLSPLALKQSSKIIAAIQLHPFNTELAKGTLMLASDTVRTDMLAAFYKSTVFE